MSLYISIPIFILGNYILIKMHQKGMDPNHSKLAYFFQCVGVILIIGFGGLACYETLELIGVYGEVTWIVIIALIAIEYGIYKLFIVPDQIEKERIKNEERQKEHDERIREQTMQEIERKKREEEYERIKEESKRIRKERITNIMSNHHIDNIEQKIIEFEEFLEMLEEEDDFYENYFCAIGSEGVKDSVDDYFYILIRKFKVCFFDLEHKYYPNKDNSPFFERWHGPENIEDYNEEEDTEDYLELLVLFFLNFALLKNIVQKIVLDYNIQHSDLEKFSRKMMLDYSHYASYPLDYKKIKEFVFERCEIVHQVLLESQSVKIILPELEEGYFNEREEDEYEGSIYSVDKYKMEPGDRYIIDFGKHLYNMISQDLGIDESKTIYFALEKPTKLDIELDEIKLYKQGDYVICNDNMWFDIELYVVVMDENDEVLYC